ncbi:MAG: hypothetical protein ACE5EU_09685 [Paracoccaceae bacterium]
MSQRLRVPALCAVAVLLLAGASVVEPEPRETPKPEAPPDLVQCREPRPQICIQIYLPVCAELRNDTRRTYPSGCVACSDANVTGYRPGRCE